MLAHLGSSEVKGSSERTRSRHLGRSMSVCLGSRPEVTFLIDLPFKNTYNEGPSTNQYLNTNGSAARAELNTLGAEFDGSSLFPQIQGIAHARAYFSPLCGILFNSVGVSVGLPVTENHKSAIDYASYAPCPSPSGMYEDFFPGSDDLALGPLAPTPLAVTQAVSPRRMFSDEGESLVDVSRMPSHMLHSVFSPNSQSNACGGDTYRWPANSLHGFSGGDISATQVTPRPIACFDADCFSHTGDEGESLFVGRCPAPLLASGSSISANGGPSLCSHMPPSGAAMLAASTGSDQQMSPRESRELFANFNLAASRSTARPPQVLRRSSTLPDGAADALCRAVDASLQLPFEHPCPSASPRSRACEEVQTPMNLTGSPSAYRSPRFLMQPATHLPQPSGMSVASSNSAQQNLMVRKTAQGSQRAMALSARVSRVVSSTSAHPAASSDTLDPAVSPGVNAFAVSRELSCRSATRSLAGSEALSNQAGSKSGAVRRLWQRTAELGEHIRRWTAARVIQRAYRLHLFRLCFEYFGESRVGYVGKLAWLLPRADKFGIGTEAASAADIEEWGELKSAAPPERVCDPLGAYLTARRRLRDQRKMLAVQESLGQLDADSLAVHRANVEKEAAAVVPPTRSDSDARFAVEGSYIPSVVGYAPRRRKRSLSASQQLDAPAHPFASGYSAVESEGAVWGSVDVRIVSDLDPVAVADLVDRVAARTETRRGADLRHAQRRMNQRMRTINSAWARQTLRVGAAASKPSSPVLRRDSVIAGAMRDAVSPMAMSSPRGSAPPLVRMQSNACDPVSPVASPSPAKLSIPVATRSYDAHDLNTVFSPDAATSNSLRFATVRNNSRTSSPQDAFNVPHLSFPTFPASDRPDAGPPHVDGSPMGASSLSRLGIMNNITSTSEVQDSVRESAPVSDDGSPDERSRCMTPTNGDMTNNVHTSRRLRPDLSPRNGVSRLMANVLDSLHEVAMGAQRRLAPATPSAAPAATSAESSSSDVCAACAENGCCSSCSSSNDAASAPRSRAVSLRQRRAVPPPQLVIPAPSSSVSGGQAASHGMAAAARESPPSSASPDDGLVPVRPGAAGGSRASVSFTPQHLLDDARLRSPATWPHNATVPSLPSPVPSTAAPPSGPTERFWSSSRRMPPASAAGWGETEGDAAGAAWSLSGTTWVGLPLLGVELSDMESLASDDEEWRVLGASNDDDDDGELSDDSVLGALDSGLFAGLAQAAAAVRNQRKQRRSQNSQSHDTASEARPAGVAEFRRHHASATDDLVPLAPGASTVPVAERFRDVVYEVVARLRKFKRLNPRIAERARDATRVRQAALEARRAIASHSVSQAHSASNTPANRLSASLSPGPPGASPSPHLPVTQASRLSQSWHHQRSRRASQHSSASTPFSVRHSPAAPLLAPQPLPRLTSAGSANPPRLTPDAPATLSRRPSITVSSVSERSPAALQRVPLSVPPLLSSARCWDGRVATCSANGREVPLLFPGGVAADGEDFDDSCARGPPSLFSEDAFRTSPRVPGLRSGRESLVVGGTGNGSVPLLTSPVMRVPVPRSNTAPVRDPAQAGVALPSGAAAPPSLVRLGSGLTTPLMHPNNSDLLGSPAVREPLLSEPQLPTGASTSSLSSFLGRASALDAHGSPELDPFARPFGQLPLSLGTPAGASPIAPLSPSILRGVPIGGSPSGRATHAGGLRGPEEWAGGSLRRSTTAPGTPASSIIINGQSFQLAQPALTARASHAVSPVVAPSVALSASAIGGAPGAGGMAASIGAASASNSFVTAASFLAPTPRQSGAVGVPVPQPSTPTGFPSPGGVSFGSGDVNWLGRRP